MPAKVLPDSNGAHHPEQHANPFIDRLRALRQSAVVTLLCLAAVFAALFPFANDIYAIASEPVRNVLPANSQMIATGVTSTFFAPFKLTLLTALCLIAPVILHQFWRFLGGSLYRSGLRLPLVVMSLSIILFYGGILFAYFVIFPLVMAFFTSIGPQEILVTPDINNYLDIALKLFFAFGLAFEIPVAVILMLHTGITTPQALAAKRAYIVVGCFVIAMLLTPPDPFSQAMLAVPMWLLFEAGLWGSALLSKLGIQRQT